ncbi:hypothetical protein TNCV_2492761 [Trichonephila clavipes]|uniref:Uncharacterized protein n=1 Tax=Trichonephila clavipes TaxID=2585209 RepID=A0A8X6RRA1_TRICX|nr:hypothetical protein TNCV_2492761 [Trichonephila clavipes]
MRSVHFGIYLRKRKEEVNRKNEMFTLSRTHRKALAVEQLFKTCLPGRCSKTDREHLRIVKRFLLPDNCVLYRLEHKYSSDSLNLRCTVAFSQRSSSSRLIEDETSNDSDIINNLMDYEDGQEKPDSWRMNKNMQGFSFPTNCVPLCHFFALFEVVAPKLREQCPVAGVGIEISRYALVWKTVLTPSDQPFQ